MSTRTVVAFGGGVLIDKRLIKYCCDLVPKSRYTGRKLKLAYLPTACGDQGYRVELFQKTFAEDYESIEVSVVRLMERPGSSKRFSKVLTRETAVEEIRQRQHDIYSNLANEMLAQDVIFVGGGSTLNLLSIWRLHQVDKILKQCYEAGTILCGSSAGAICWFKGGITDSYGPILPLYDGLGFLPYRCCPHFTSGERKHSVNMILLAEAAGQWEDKEKPELIGIDDFAAIHFENEKILTSVRVEADRSVYKVALGDKDAFSLQQVLPLFDIQEKDKQ